MTSDWQYTYRAVFERLPGFQDFGNGRGRAACPCHGADQADIWLAVGDGGRLLIRCYPHKSGTAPCQLHDLVQTMGITMAHLFPDWIVHEEARQKDAEKRKAGRGGRDKHKGKGWKMRDTPKNESYTTEGQYSYFDVDATGKKTLVFEVVKRRYTSGKKNYPQRRPNPDYNPAGPRGNQNPEWLWNLTGVKPVLYKLPELRAALVAEPDRWVFVVEGELDTETAYELGLVATTSPGGAGKWTHPQYAAELKGCNVIVIPDEDPVDGVNQISPGIEHMKQVVTALLPVAQRVKVLRLPGVPPHGDLTDWRRTQAGTPDEIRTRLQALAQPCPVIKDVKELDKITPRQFAAPPQAAVPDQKPSNGQQTLPGVPTDPEPPVQPEPIQTPSPPPPIQPQATSPPLPPATQPDPPPPRASAMRPRLALPGISAALAEELELVARDLATVSRPPGNLAEWFGTVWPVWLAFQAEVGKLEMSAKDMRDAAVHLAAHLLRGVDSLRELR